MPTPTYTPLANLTLSSSAASVTFSSISQAYRDLVLVIDVLGTGNVYPYVRLNSDTGTNYSYVAMEGDGATTASTTNTQAFFSGSNTGYATTSNRLIVKFDFMDYSTTDKHKSILKRSNIASSGTEAIAGRWANTSAVTTLQVYASANNFASGSTFALYGIAA